MHYKTGYREKTPTILEPHHYEFVKLYAESFDSLAAYTASHKHILKVKASSLLQSAEVWEHIMRRIIDTDHLTSIQQKPASIYRLCIDRTGSSPCQIYNSYTSQGRKKDSNPIDTIKKIVYAYHFFSYLRREYFTKKLYNELVSEMEYLQFLFRNAAWITEFNLFKSRIEKDGIIFSKIINHGKEED